MCYLGWCGCVVTYDQLALRVWDLQGQLKCTHNDKTETENKLIKLHAVDSMAVFLGLYTSKSSNSTSLSGYMRVFSEMLSIVQEIDLSLPRIERAIFFPDQLCFALFDSSKTAHILYIDHPGSAIDNDFAAANRNPLLDATRQAAVNANRGGTPQALSSSSAAIKPIIKLRSIQQLDCAELAVKVSILFDTLMHNFLMKVVSTYRTLFSLIMTRFSS